MPSTPLLSLLIRLRNLIGQPRDVTGLIIVVVPIFLTKLALNSAFSTSLRAAYD
ncbi:unnamed protein product [Protopolystoma xenopodis]|uniref:Uncharacterized protein n=1 Tax=Protopolystoma xenopodis TaxID=117903 RepID=A0A448WQQ7_9PLAT|nr:unnamed protein product [Protopolystoma xenopodis]